MYLNLIFTDLMLLLQFPHVATRGQTLPVVSLKLNNLKIMCRLDFFPKCKVSCKISRNSQTGSAETT